MRRPWAVIGIGAVLALGGVVAVASPASAVPVPVTFTYIAPTVENPDPFQTFTVPAGVTQITVLAEGAAGAAGATDPPGAGALGARVSTNLLVTPLETLQIRVGGAGAGTAGGYNGGGAGGDAAGDGGGGGGASDLRVAPYSSSERTVIAGGGGGGGAGASGFGSGGAGGAGSETGDNGSSGTCASGGTGGINAGGGGTAGGGGIFEGGGGGGGGALGGGGGGGCSEAFVAGGGGGGGGSSLGPAGATFEAGVRSGNGTVTITYEGAGVGAQPDVQVRKGTTLPYVGDGIYYPTEQKVKTNVPGNSQTFQFKVENDGPTAEAFTLSATPGNSVISGKYKVGATNITSAIVAGTYVTPVLSPGESITITLNVGGTASAPNGTKKGFTVRATGASLIDRATGVIKAT